MKKRVLKKQDSSEFGAEGRKDGLLRKTKLNQKSGIVNLRLTVVLHKMLLQKKNVTNLTEN